MEPALEVLHRALQGEEGARQFLDRTCHIYVLDATTNNGNAAVNTTSTATTTNTTTTTMPHTYGCWNFIHQAMNEVERVEIRSSSSGDSTTSTTNSHNFIPHAQLLASMALRVARRSNATDAQLFQTCLDNAATTTANHHHTILTQEQASRLKDINTEIRDIVMGRLAALCLDPSYSSSHPHPNHPNHHNTTTAVSSCLSHPLVLETFCAALAANAVSNGAGAMQHLVSDWMVTTTTSTSTSSTSPLPPLCVTSLILHLALETSRLLMTTTQHDDHDDDDDDDDDANMEDDDPDKDEERMKDGDEDNHHDHANHQDHAGAVIEALQQLSSIVMAQVLAPVLQQQQQQVGGKEEEDASSSQGNNDREERTQDRITALAFRAMHQWCQVTDLTLAQIKHICTKVHVNIVEIFSDAMYSDSRLVLDALADLIQGFLNVSSYSSDGKRRTIRPRRMAQVRHILGVSLEEFQQKNIQEDDLLQIEAKETQVILQEFTTAIGLQRFRFSQRQASGDLEVCRNLARMGAAIAQACHATTSTSGGGTIRVGPGLMELLLQAAAHPSVDVSGIALEVLERQVVVQGNDGAGLVHQLLPILQGRAIAAHSFPKTSTSSIRPSLIPEDLPEYNGYLAFDHFRRTCLTDCLLACYRAQPDVYMTSCVAAIEEFCTPQATLQVTFHLEAAFFCVGAVSSEVVPAVMKADVVADEKEVNSSTRLKDALTKCMLALDERDRSFYSNPLTMAQACSFLQKYSKCLAGIPGALNIAARVALTTFQLCATEFAISPECLEMKREGHISPFTNAASALKSFLCENPLHFVRADAITCLGAGWEASYAASNRIDILTIQDRQNLCQGICCVLAHWPMEQRFKSLLALAMPTLNCLETMLQHARGSISDSDRLDSILNRLSAEVIMVRTIATSFSECVAVAQAPPSQQQPTDQNDSSGASAAAATTLIQEPALDVVRRAWPTLLAVAREFSTKPVIVAALQNFLYGCVPSDWSDELSSSMAFAEQRSAVSSAQS